MWMKPLNHRLAELDGLRAIAALFVVLYHYFSRWSEVLPYGAVLRPLADYGYLGVNLFFIISGFVISMSLKNCPSIIVFAQRRLIRLMPAMIICSLVTFAVMWWIDSSFALARRQEWTSFLPSWTFIEPTIWRRIFPVGDWIDGAYWTLFVELKFYVLAAFAWFVVGRRHFRTFFLIALVVGFSSEAWLPRSALRTLLVEHLFFPTYLPLFCVGIAFAYLLNCSRSWRTWILLGLGFVLSIMATSGAGARLIILLFFGMFVLLIYQPFWTRWLGTGSLVWIGLVSYPLYLLHQNIGVAIMTTIPDEIMSYWFYIVVFLITFGILILAVAVHHWVELPVQAAFKRYGVKKVKWTD